MKGNTTRPTHPERVTVLAKVLPYIGGGLENIGQSAARDTGHLRHIFKRCLGLGYNIRLCQRPIGLVLSRSIAEDLGGPIGNF
jgi:hypothetical protein